MANNNGTACFNCNKAYMNCLNSCPNSPMKQDSAKVYKVAGKKPVYNCARGALCPVCDGELYPKFVYVRRFKHEEIRIEEKAPYCKHCGHALDWGKESEGKEKIPPYVRMGAKALPAILNVKYTEDGE